METMEKFAQIRPMETMGIPWTTSRWKHVESSRTSSIQFDDRFLLLYTFLMVMFQFAKWNKLLELLENKWWRPCTKTWKPLSDELIEGIIPNESHLPGMIWVKDREPTNMFKICKSACTMADPPSKKCCFSMATLLWSHTQAISDPKKAVRWVFDLPKM